MGVQQSLAATQQLEMVRCKINRFPLRGDNLSFQIVDQEGAREARDRLTLKKEAAGKGPSGPSQGRKRPRRAASLRSTDCLDAAST